MRTTHCLASLNARWVLKARSLAAVYCVVAMGVSVARSETPEGLAKPLAVLVDAGVVSASDYWGKNSVPGRFCEGEEVANLLLRSAQQFEPAENLEQALDVLTRRKIIWNDYWAMNALRGGRCKGEYVATVIRLIGSQLADLELTGKYAPPDGVITLREPSAFALPMPAGGTGSGNLILGTQTFGATYQFTGQSRLLETATAIRDMGATVIKFQLSKRYAGETGNVPAADPTIRSLTDLVRSEPSHRQVLDMPFRHFVLWAHCFGGDALPSWRGGFSEEEAKNEYQEIRELTTYLLQTYSGTGKTFYLGHWEGDGWLRHNIDPESDSRVTPAAVKGFTDWLNKRQQAVDDAKRAAEYSGVQVWHYTEVNHVWLAMQGRPALVNRILPHTTVDLVSYSSYDTAADPARLKAALNYIESQLPAKPQISGRRVFIGEYGFPACQHTPEEQDRRSRQVIRAALEWGCPFVLYWELYNNEVDEGGNQRGFWMIDDKGNKQPVYHTHRQFYGAARDYSNKYRAQHGRHPGDNEFRRWAVGWFRQR